MQLIAALLLAAAGPSSDLGPTFLLEDSLLTRAWAPASESRLLAAADRVSSERSDDAEEPVRKPDPPQDGRIRATHGSFHNRFALDERRFGVGIQPGYAMIQGGSVVKGAYTDGPSITLRLIASVSEAQHFYLDIAWSHHGMRDPRPMLFRTAYTPSSGWARPL